MNALSIPVLDLGGPDPASFGIPEEARIRLFQVEGVDVFCSVLRESTPIGLIVTALVEGSINRTLSQILTRVPDSQLVVGVGDRPVGRRLRPIVGEGVGVHRVILGPQPNGLEAALRAAWFDARIADVHRRLDASGFKWLLKSALRKILARELKRDSGPFHTLTALGLDCGVSRSSLDRACEDTGIRLSDFMFLWVAALALRAKFLSGMAWSTVALRCGYAGESGLTALFDRVLGHGLREAGLSDIHSVLTTLEKLASGSNDSFRQGPEL